MRYPDRTDARGTVEATPAPSHCPACRSSEISTVSKVVSADSYWRCGGCGEVWNVARLNAASRHRGFNSFRR